MLEIFAIQHTNCMMGAKSNKYHFCLTLIVWSIRVKEVKEQKHQIE